MQFQLSCACCYLLQEMLEVGSFQDPGTKDKMDFMSSEV